MQIAFEICGMACCVIVGFDFEGGFIWFGVGWPPHFDRGSKCLSRRRELEWIFMVWFFLIFRGGCWGGVYMVGLFFCCRLWITPVAILGIGLGGVAGWAFFAGKPAFGA